MGNVANATAIQGHVENRLFDCRPAAMVTVRDEKRLRWTGRILTAGPWFPLGGSPMWNHVCVLTSGTTNLEVGHGDLHASVSTAFWRLLRQTLETTRAVFRKQHSWNTTIGGGQAEKFA